MSGQQKRGFRLPWSAERGTDEANDGAADQETLDSTPAAVGEDLGGPFRPAGSSPALTIGAAPEAPDVPDDSAEAEMIDTDAMNDRIARAAGDGVEPTGEGGDGATASGRGQETSAAAERTPATPRRENPLVAGLVKAMREAALASRAETTTRLQTEASARIEAIRAASTEEAAALRKRVDDDIAGIREWSKLEMARIRAETEHRIEERRADAINENQRLLDSVEQLVEQVQATVANYEAETDRFFERLLAEADPARLATLAEQAPEPPDMTGELPKPIGWTSFADDEADDVRAVAEDSAAGGGDAGTDSTTEADVVDAGALEAAAAAEAEAAATEGLDLSTAEDWPAAVMAAARRSEAVEAPAEGDDSIASRLIVSGLTSVAGISAFKGAVAGLAGVRSVSVSTGERGVFIFSVSHDQEADLAEAVATLTSFNVEITETTDEGLGVTAHEPVVA